MNALLAVISGIVVVGMIIVFIRQNNKLQTARRNYRLALKEVGTCNAKLRFYHGQIEGLLQNLSIEELSDLREKVVDDRKNAECYKPSSQRSGRLVACREMVNIIDAVLSQRA